MSTRTAPAGPRKRPRISDIAREAGVSSATVDRVLHGRPGVKKQTIDLILSTAERLAYGLPDMPAHNTPKKLQFDVILPVGPNTFMDMLAEELVRSCQAMKDASVTLTVHRVDRFDPQVLASHIRKTSAHTQGMAILPVESPMVREAINEVTDAGIPVVTLVSDLSTSRRLAFVGLDNRAAGRTAGHLLGRMVPRAEGKVLLFAGSFTLNYRDHEEREMGFQRILSERFPNLHVIARLESHDDFHETYEQTKRSLQHHPDIIGIYNISAGNRGIGAALEETGFSDKIVYIGHELTKYSRQYLVNGTMDAVIDQSPEREAKRALGILYGFHRNPQTEARQGPLPIQIFVSENIP